LISCIFVILSKAKGLLFYLSSRAKRRICSSICHPEQSEGPAFLICHPEQSEGSAFSFVILSKAKDLLFY